jgi:hypothetical protein
MRDWEAKLEESIPNLLRAHLWLECTLTVVRPQLDVSSLCILTKKDHELSEGSGFEFC